MIFFKAQQSFLRNRSIAAARYYTTACIFNRVSRASATVRPSRSKRLLIDDVSVNLKSFDRAEDAKSKIVGVHAIDQNSQ